MSVSLERRISRLEKQAKAMIAKDAKREQDRESMKQAITKYVQRNGAVQVWREWRDTMLAQGRNVDLKYMKWPIPQQDIELDSAIAQAVIEDFLMWLESHDNL